MANLRPLTRDGSAAEAITKTSHWYIHSDELCCLYALCCMLDSRIVEFNEAFLFACEKLRDMQLETRACILVSFALFHDHEIAVSIHLSNIFFASLI